MLEVGLRMSGETVGQALDRVLTGVSGPRSIKVDHGTEFQSRALEDWAFVGAYSSTSFDRVNPWEMLSLNRVTDAYGTSV